MKTQCSRKIIHKINNDLLRVLQSGDFTDTTYLKVYYEFEHYDPSHPRNKLKACGPDVKWKIGIASANF